MGERDGERERKEGEKEAMEVILNILHEAPGVRCCGVLLLGQVIMLSHIHTHRHPHPPTTHTSMHTHTFSHTHTHTLPSTHHVYLPAMFNECMVAVFVVGCVCVCVCEREGWWGVKSIMWHIFTMKPEKYPLGNANKTICERNMID